MRFSVFAHTLNDARRSLIRWTLTLTGVALGVVLVYLLIGLFTNGRAFSVRLPEDLALLLAGDPARGGMLADLRTWASVMGLELILPLLLVFFAVRQGSGLVAGEEESGSLGMLLAAPIQRYRLIVEKFAVLCLLVLGPSLGAGILLAFAGLLAGGTTAVAWAVGMIPAAAHLFLLGLVFGALAMAIGSLTGRRLLSQNLILGFALLSLAASRLPLETNWSVLRLFSPFYYYHQALLTQRFFPYAWALAGLAAVFFALAWLAFEHRDLAV